MCLPFKIYNQVLISIISSAGKCTLNTDWLLNSSWQDERGKGETLVLGSSRSLDCGGLIHNTSCPSPPGQQMAVWMFKCVFFVVFFFFVCFIPKAERWLHLPVSSPGQHSPLSPFPNLRYICDSCGRKTCKLDSKGIIRSVERDFLWVFACWVRIINPDVRDSGGLWPTSLHLTGITPPTTLRFSSGASALHSSNNIPYANFIITPQQWGMCASVQWRGI